MSLYDVLHAAGLTARVVLPDGIDALLRALEPDADPEPLGPGATRGLLRLVGDVGAHPVPGFDVAFALPDPQVRVPYVLRLTPSDAPGNPTGFGLWVEIGGEEHVAPYLGLITGAPGLALTGASKQVGPDGLVTLVPLPPGDPLSRPRLVCASPGTGADLVPSLLVSGSATEPAGIRFTPDTASTEGIVELALRPPTVVFGQSGVGFELASLSLDDSGTATAPVLDAPAAGGAPDVPPDSPARRPEWRGLVARGISWVLPSGLPLFGGQELRGHVVLGRGAGGVDLVVTTRVPPRETEPRRPGYEVRVECRDPAATGLSGLVPTLVTATMDLPLDGASQSFPTDGHGTQQVTFGAGRPVRATATLSRDPLTDTLRVAVAVSAQGSDGLLAVRSRTSADVGAKIFVVAAGLASALIADRNVARDAQVGDTRGVLLNGLLAAGGALSALFEPDAGFVLHSAEIESSGPGLPVGGPVVLTLDYSVAVRVVTIEAGPLHLGMSPDQPLRIRVRGARLALDPRRSGLDMVALDVDRATIDVEDPGRWDVAGLQQLFDVLRSRSGRGSTWFEVDLRFKVDLGPITVEGATVRVTLNGGTPEVTVRGLRAGLEIPGVITGTGGLRLLDGGGFDADLRASVVPLGLGVYSRLAYLPPKILLDLDADLPAPVPLANSGLGLLGAGVTLGFSARPDYGGAAGEASDDTIRRQIRWNQRDPESWAIAPGQSSFGIGAAIGTLPDLGFTFSARAGLLITVPDVAVRGSLSGRLLAPPVRMSDPVEAGFGVSYLGFLSVDETAIAFGIAGRIDLRPLLEAELPLAGYFPLPAHPRGTAAWFLHLGTDGGPGREGGPVSVRVLPDVAPTRADAYLMVRGDGIQAWPHRAPLLTVDGGLVIAFGFALQTTFGVRPLVWADLHASLDVLIGSRPMTLAGYGTAGGSLNLGPFSLGVEAAVTFLHTGGDTYVRASVTGRIRLLFITLRGTVTISFGDREPPPVELMAPERHPLDRHDAQTGARAGVLACLTDDRYEVLAGLSEDPATAPAVWPDAIVALPFAVPPQVAATAADQLPGVQGPDAPRAVPLGTEMLTYTWRLDDVTVRDVTGEPGGIGPGVPVPGVLAARWQTPRGDSGRTDVVELHLFSTGPDLWVNRTADGGRSLPGGGPLAPGASICTPGPPDPAPGWALGFAATSEVPGFRLPPETLSTDPLVCRVSARLAFSGVLDGEDGLEDVPLDGVAVLPAPSVVEPAALVRTPWPFQADRAFDGLLGAPRLSGADPGFPVRGGYVGQRHHLLLDEPVTAGVLVLAVDPAAFAIGDVSVPFRVDAVPVDSLGATVELTAEGGEIPWDDDPEGIFLFRWSDLPVGALRVSCPLGVRIWVAGVGGVTRSAVEATERERRQRAAEAERRADAAREGPPRPQPAVDGGARAMAVPHQRAILAPGRTYRIDVAMSWSARLVRQVPGGGTEVTASGFRQAPGRSLYFATVPAADSADVAPLPTAPEYRDWLRGIGRPFHPEMLQRFLGGYEPGQGQECRFRDDPLRAHFTADHVAALAAAYGFALVVAVRRVDRAGPEHAAPFVPLVTWWPLTAPEILDPVERARFDLAHASPCPVPVPGATLSADASLAPLAWYEVFVGARRSGRLRGSLPGVTFRTSRWRSPAEMVAGLGFAVAGFAPAAVMTGDLEVSAEAAAATATLTGDDQAFDRALAALGIAGWPPVVDVRVSRLWAWAWGEWRLAGVLLESPEPVHRPGRVHVEALEGRSPFGAVGLELRRRDRSGSRLLFLFGEPEPVGFSPQAVWGLDQELTVRVLATPEGPVTGTLPLPLLPSFAGDPR